MARSLNPDPRDDAQEAGPLSLADLRDVSRLRKDLARSEEELRLLREQLGHALAGWHTEQQRALALEQRLKAWAAPAPADPPEAAPAHAPQEQEIEPTEAPDTKPGLLAGLLDFLRD